VPRTYDAEFRRRVVELVRAGRPVRVVAAELGLAEATVYRWKAQDLIDRGIKPGSSSHLDLFLSLSRLANDLHELGHHERARKLHEQALAM
jgi:transposase-like protein